MVDRNADVMEMVEEELQENPDIANKDLKLQAEEIDEGIEELSARQFNARYPLQVKRQLSVESDGSADGGAPSSKEATEEAESSTGQESSDEDTKERVFQMIEEALEENPDVSNEVLQERAAEIDPSIEDLSARSFHARYPLQVKRQMSSGQAQEEEEPKEETTVERDEFREELRETLLAFAKAVAGADDRGEVIDVLTDIDEYVDRVMEKA